MTIRPMPAAQTETLRQALFSYDAVGGTRASAPTGFHALRRERVLNRRDFDGAVDDLMTWQVQSRAGLRCSVSHERVVVDAVVASRLGLGVLGVTAPCRIVYVVDETDRCGFAYGTLPGHPEAGEEAFVLTRAGDGRITLTITAFSRPATTVARLSGPLGRVVQRVITERYLRALDRPA